MAASYPRFYIDAVVKINPNEKIMATSVEYDLTTYLVQNNNSE